MLAITLTNQLKKLFYVPFNRVTLYIKTLIENNHKKLYFIVI